MSLLEDFELDECIEWIRRHNFRNVAVQLNREWLSKSSQITSILQSAHDDLDVFIIVSQSCSADYVSPQHLGVGHIQALVRIGRTCLARPPSTVPLLPTFFAFTKLSQQDPEFKFITETLDTIDRSEQTLILSETHFASAVVSCVSNDEHTEIGKLVSYCDDWHFSESSHRHLITTELSAKETQARSLGAFQFRRCLNEYGRIIYVGEQVPLHYRVLYSPDVWHLNPKRQTYERVATDKELRKRVALIEKVKKAKHVGFVLTHSYPEANEHFDLVQRFQQKCRKNNRFQSTMISLVQTTDECKLGNFDTIDTFVIINHCFCSTLIDRIRMHVPLLNFDEFRIARNESIRYGEIDWNVTSDEANSVEEDDDEEEEDAQNKQLVERQFNRQTWYGLEVNAGQDLPSDLQQGLDGIASGYQTEPV